MLDLFELHNIMPSFPSMHVSQFSCQIMWQSWDKWYCRYKIFSKGKEISLFLQTKTILEVINNFFFFPKILKNFLLYSYSPMNWKNIRIFASKDREISTSFRYLDFLATRNNCCKPKFSQNRKKRYTFCLYTENLNEHPTPAYP